MSFIGLDIGLTGCKACLFDEDTGRLLASAYREYRTETPRPGRQELNPATVWRGIREVLAALADTARKDTPKALAVSSHGESAVPVGPDGADLANAISTLDQRITDLDDIMSGGMATPEMCAVTGQPPHTMYTLPHILWLRRHQPDLVEKTWKFLCFQEYALYRLGAEKPATSYSQAARTWAFDVHRKEWSAPLLSSYGLDADIFAQAVPAGTVIGEMSPAVSDELGLPAAIRLVTGGHDQACGALGTGVVRSGLAVDATGTVECITPSFALPLPADVVMKYNFCNSPHVVDGLYVTFAWNITGGSLLKWYRDTLSHAEAQALAKAGRDFYAESLQGLPSGPSGLLVLPHFAGSGTPWFWKDSSGTILGLDFQTDKKRLLAAFLEGVTFEMKYNLTMLGEAGLEVERFMAAGGGAKSDAWLQIKADIFGRPVVRTDVTEGACLGCAMLCAHALHGAPYEYLAREWVREVRVFEPDPERTARYKRYLDLYYQMIAATRPVLKQLHRLRTASA